jgi:hypothetical protein
MSTKQKKIMETLRFIFLVVAPTMLLIASLLVNGRPLNDLSKYFSLVIVFSGFMVLKNGQIVNFFSHVLLGIVIFLLADYDSYLHSNAKSLKEYYGIGERFVR